MAKKSPQPQPDEQETLTPENTGQDSAPPFPDAGEPEGKSIAEALAEGSANKVPQIAQDQTDIADAQIGDRVNHPNLGDGTVVSRNDITLWVRFDRNPSDDPSMFGIQFVRGTLTMLQGKLATTAPPAGHVFLTSSPTNPVPEAARFITPEEIEAHYQQAMAAHVAKSQELAAAWQAAKDDQTRRQQELNEVHAELKEIVAQMVAHGAAVPKREEAHQRTIGFDPGAPGGDQTVVRSTAPTPSQDSLGYSVPGDSVLSLKDSGLTLRNLHDALFPEFKPGKKAKDVGKMGVEIKGSGYLIREKSPDGTRWFAQLLVDKETWEQNFQAEYGAPVQSFDTSVEARQDRTKGGADCGRIVKVDRQTCVLAPESQGLVIVASKEEVEKYVSWQKASEKPEGERGEMGVDDSD